MCVRWHIASKSRKRSVSGSWKWYQQRSWCQWIFFPLLSHIWLVLFLVRHVAHNIEWEEREKKKQSVISATKTPFENDNNISNLEFMNELQCDLKRKQWDKSGNLQNVHAIVREIINDSDYRIFRKWSMTIARNEQKHQQNQQAPFIIPNKSS